MIYSFKVEDFRVAEMLDCHGEQGEILVHFIEVGKIFLQKSRIIDIRMPCWLNVVVSPPVSLWINSAKIPVISKSRVVSLRMT